MDEKELLKKMTKLGCEAIEGKLYRNICTGEDGKYIFDSITNVNFKPHPFTIGTRHVVHASDHFMGSLGNEAIEDLERLEGPSCAYFDGKGRCRVPYAEHTSDRVAFLKVKSDKELKENKDISKFLYACKQILIDEKIDGIGFVKWD